MILLNQLLRQLEFCSDAAERLILPEGKWRQRQVIPLQPLSSSGLKYFLK